MTAPMAAEATNDPATTLRSDEPPWLARGRARSVRRDPETATVIKRFRHPRVLYRLLDRRRAAREFRCLELLHAAGVRVPRPLEVRASQGGWEVRMEEVSGAVSLESLLAADPPRPLGWERVLTSLGRNLARLHGAGVAHPDLKPGNVLVDEWGLPWLVDFHGAHPGQETSPRRLLEDVVAACAAGRERLGARLRLRFLLAWLHALPEELRSRVLERSGNDVAGLARGIEHEGRLHRRALVAHGAGRWLRDSSRACVRRTPEGTRFESRRAEPAEPEAGRTIVLEGPARELRERWLAAARLVEHGIASAHPDWLEITGRRARAGFELPFEPIGSPAAASGVRAFRIGRLLGSLHDRGVTVRQPGPALLAHGREDRVAFLPPAGLATFDPLSATAEERLTGFEDLAWGPGEARFREGYLRAFAGRPEESARVAASLQSRSPFSRA